MEKIMISACLIGEQVKYNGKDNLQESEILNLWQKEGRLVPICPEVEGGLPVPRNPAEIVGGEGTDILSESYRVIDKTGKDVTAAFLQGAEETLKVVRKHEIQLAVLKEGSPSCGSGAIYNGRFTGTKITGQGVTTALLRKHNVTVFSEEQLPEALKHLKKLETM